jgi:hypothetical protein
MFLRSKCTEKISEKGFFASKRKKIHFAENPIGGNCTTADMGIRDELQNGVRKSKE